MQTYFTINLGSQQFDCVRMNVTAPKLFQVFTQVNNEKRRFHIQGNGIDTLLFVNRADVPEEVLKAEALIAEKIFELNRAGLDS